MGQGKPRIHSPGAPGLPARDLAKSIARLVAEATDDLRRALKAVARRGADVRRVHKLRSASRRLESLAPLLEALGVRRSDAKFARQARRHAGAVRDLDTVLAELRRLRGVGTLERAKLERIMASRRARKAQRLERWCARHAADLHSTSRISREIRAAMRGRDFATSGRFVREQIEKTAAALCEQLRECHRSVEAMHRMRIASKELRHALELAMVCAGSPPERRRLAARLADVKRITRVCGAAQDAEVLREVIAEESAREPLAFPETLRRAVRLATTRHQAAVVLVARVAPGLIRALTAG